MNASPVTTRPAGATATARMTGPAWLATSIAVFLVAATAPYVWLIVNFGYDDILREPAGQVLRAFHAGGTPLILAWLAFALSALMFIPVVLAMSRLAADHGQADGGAVALGVAAAVAQCIGLMRWVLVVPGLARTYTDPAASMATHDATVVVFEAVHQMAGTVVGEMVGQLLLAAWTARVAVQMWHMSGVPRWLPLAGLATLPFWLIGQTEVLSGVTAQVPSIELIPVAFMGWELWLLVTAVVLAWALRPRQAAHPAA